MNFGNIKPKVAVAVITHNGKRYLKTCIESLLNQTYKNFDIFLIDNASTDGSSEYVMQNFPIVKIIRFEKNLGFAKAYNTAIRMINADYVALLNDDTKAHSRWLEELVNAAVEDERVGVLGSLILFLDKPNIVQHAGGKITPIGGGMDVGFGRPLQMIDCKKKHVGYVCGAAMLVRKDIFEKIGGFDSDYFAYFEDVDLCWRMWLYGYKVLFVPSSIVYHKFGGSWGKRLTSWRLYFSHLNKLRNTVKNLEPLNSIKGLLLNAIFDVVRILLLIVSRRVREATYIVKAWMTFIKDFKSIYAKRIRIQQVRKIRDYFLFKMHLICSLPEGIREFLRLDLSATVLS
jgi:GT2 family glycosyltransferase